MIWFSLLIPVLAIPIIFILFNKKMTWWEFLIPVATAIICIIISIQVSESSQIKDQEFWGAYAINATYYEEWNEKVSCSHPEYCTRSSTDSNGNTTTETYQCGWKHPYDVDYHPPKWILLDSNGTDHNIEQGYWESLTIRWKNKSFQELNRDYHSIDGDAYITNWDSKDETLEAITTLHTYKNRVQAAEQSLFNFKEVSLIDKNNYQLFEYPTINGFQCQDILGNAEKIGLAQRNLEIFNAKFGSMKQVRVMFLIFQNQPLEAAMLQESYWKGGNKNEFIVCVGVDQSQLIQWTYIISWTEVDQLKFEVRDEITNLKKLDLPQAVNITTNLVKDKFKRKQFEDFNYLTVLPSSNAIIWTYLIVLFTTIGISIWAVLNEFVEIEQKFGLNPFNRNEKINAFTFKNKIQPPTLKKVLKDKWEYFINKCRLKNYK